MNTTIRVLACGLALTGAVVCAADLPAARTKGRVLILANERTLEGDILQVGSDYRIRRAVGESWVPGDNVLRLCADWKEAYQFLKTRANQADPDERVRLARWCQLHELHKEALAEASAALELRPNFGEARRLQNLLRRAVASTKPAPAAPPAAPLTPLPAVDLTTESVSLFATRVQPILMNACASCHANNGGGEFHLMRVLPGSVNQRATRHNLAATVRQIDRHRPDISPLLIKAISMHGTTRQVPLKGRQSAAYRNLQSWVEMTLANNPQLTEAPARPAPERDLGPRAEQPKAARPADDIAPFRPAEAADPNQPDRPTVVSMSGSASHTLPLAPEPVASPGAPASPPVRSTPRPEPAPPADPVDPFDPVIFNRQMHPENR